MNFQISPIARARFAPLFGRPDADLARAGARRIVVDASPGYPCRVSLRDARIGEAVLLLNHTHLDGDGPYRASHAIFVVDGAEEAVVAPGVVPEALARRVLSLRAFNTRQDMVDSDLAEGAGAVADVVERMFARDDVVFMHAHNAKPGCFAARIDRAPN